MKKLEWQALRAMHYLVDETGQILAMVRRTPAGTYKAHYAGIVEDYIDLDSARRNVLVRVEEGLEKLKAAAKPKEKGDGGKNT